jgi:hypothetical protein
MRNALGMAALMAALSFGSGLALQLGTPNAVPAAPKAESGGLNLFGYSVLPKLNFGLDVLYGQDEQQLQLGGSDDIDTLDENGNVSVIGKVKRRF